LNGTLKENRLHWDTGTFSGYAWTTTDGIILLSLDRKDEPGAMFYENIVMGKTKTHRARTRHWFKDGQLYKRTLCDECRLKDRVNISFCNIKIILSYFT